MKQSENAQHFIFGFDYVLSTFGDGYLRS